MPQVELADLHRSHLLGQPASGAACYRTKHLLVPAMVLACLHIVAARRDKTIHE